MPLLGLRASRGARGLLGLLAIRGWRGGVEQRELRVLRGAIATSPLSNDPGIEGGARRDGQAHRAIDGQRALRALAEAVDLVTIEIEGRPVRTQVGLDGGNTAQAIAGACHRLLEEVQHSGVAELAPDRRVATPNGPQ